MTDTAVRPFHYGKDVFLYPLLICLVFFFMGEYAVYETSLSAAAAREGAQPLFPSL